MTELTFVRCPNCHGLWLPGCLAVNSDRCYLCVEHDREVAERQGAARMQLLEKKVQELLLTNAELRARGH